jgi:hypothetical protein
MMAELLSHKVASKSKEYLFGSFLKSKFQMGIAFVLSQLEGFCTLGFISSVRLFLDRFRLVLKKLQKLFLFSSPANFFENIRSC